MLGTKILEERKSKYNKDIKVVKTFGLGTYIQVEGLTQSGGIVESIWKSTLKQINKLTNQPINSCLILGLGGGTVAKLLRKKYPNAKIVGVEIDPVMVELGKKYMGLDEIGVDIRIQDARKFKLEKYDLIIVDTYLGDKYAQITGFNPVMAGNTIFNRLYFGDKKIEAIKFGKKLEKIFNKVEYFYPKANLMFICQN